MGKLNCKKVILLCSALTAMSLVGGVCAWNGALTIASADSVGTALTMDAEACLRVGDETDTHTGLIYTIRMSGTDYENTYKAQGYTYGILIAPEYYNDYYAVQDQTYAFGVGETDSKKQVYDWAEWSAETNEWDYNGTNSLANGGKIRIINISANELIADGDDYILEGTVADILPANLASNFYAVGYAKKGNEVYFTSATSLSATYLAQRTWADKDSNDLTSEENQWVYDNYINVEEVLQSATTYTVRTHTQEADGSYTTTEQTLQGMVNATVTAEVISGYALNTSKSSETAVVLANGKLVWDLYYDILEEGEYLFASEQNLDKFRFAGAGVGTFVESENIPDAITGEYDGDAIAYTAKAAKSGNAWALLSIQPKITEAAYEQALADGYTQLYVWVAADYVSDNTPTLFGYGKDTSLYNKSFASLTRNTWTKITIDLTNNAESTATINSTHYDATATAYSGSTDYADGVQRMLFHYDEMNSGWSGARLFIFKTNGINQNEPATYYVGDIGFDEATRVAPTAKADEFAFVYGDTATENFTFYSDHKGEFMKGDTLGFAGDYTGDAVVYHGKSKNANGIYAAVVKVLPRITAEQYDALIAAGYTKLYVWVAAYADNGETVLIQQDSTLYNKSATYLTSKTWTKLTFALTNDVTGTTISSSNYANNDWSTYNGDVTDYASYVKDRLFTSNNSDGVGRLFRFGMLSGTRQNEDGTPTEMHCYVGNVGFEK